MLPSRDDLLGACRGVYQVSLVGGGETWSGSSLKGRAAAYAGRYAESRRNLAQRIGGEIRLVLVVGRVPRWRSMLVYRDGGRVYVLKHDWEEVPEAMVRWD